MIWVLLTVAVALFVGSFVFAVAAAFDRDTRAVSWFQLTGFVAWAVCVVLAIVR